MMAFNFKQYFEHFFRSLFPPKGSPYYLTLTRFTALILYYIFYTNYEIFTRFCFILDHIFFGHFRKNRVEDPIFIIGNFRSGSTFLHRLLFRDPDNFTSMQTWEIYFAPSITQRKLFRGFLRVDRIFGRPFGRLIDLFDTKVLSKAQIHKTQLRDPEEDEGLLVHIWSMVLLNWIFPFLDTMPQYHRYDLKLPRKKKDAIMKFYRQCVQRHIEYHGTDKIFLSKNPSFTPKIDTIRRWFPRARFIYLVREPHEMFPSVMSWFTYSWNYFSDLKETIPFNNFVVELTKHWYNYPFEYIKKHNVKYFMIVKYSDLITNPDKTISEIYKEFNLILSDKFKKEIKRVSQKNRIFKSEHNYSLEEFGFTTEEIYTLFSSVYDSYNLTKPYPDRYRNKKAKKKQKGRHLTKVVS